MTIDEDTPGSISGMRTIRVANENQAKVDLRELFAREQHFVRAIQQAHIALLKNDRPQIRQILSRELGEKDAEKIFAEFEENAFYDYPAHVYGDLGVSAVAVSLTKAKQTAKELELLAEIYPKVHIDAWPIINIEYFSAQEFLKELCEDIVKSQGVLSHHGRYPADHRTEDNQIIQDIFSLKEKADQAFQSHQDVLEKSNVTQLEMDTDDVLLRLRDIRRSQIATSLDQVNLYCATSAHILAYSATLPRNIDATWLHEAHQFVREAVTSATAQLAIVQQQMSALNAQEEAPQYYGEGQYALMPLDRFHGIIPK
ncbi:MAG: hypothetical protein J0L77_02565 [Alphaproteobacteria bacterium]|nr:hypothetical protein [Alphaproteobacteria bacterium]